jgi:hypothetical protein
MREDIQRRFSHKKAQQHKIFNSATAELEQRNLRRAAISDGKTYGPQTAIDIDLRVPETTEALQHAFACAARSAALTSDCDLAAVRVPAEHKVD